MKCAKCYKEINDTAKFCKYCGTAAAKTTESAHTDTQNCIKCGKEVPAAAKFCKFCGASLNAATTEHAKANDVENYENNIVMQDHCITWRILPSQIAVKLDEADIEKYKTVKAVYIAPGTKALFFVNGKYTAELSSGRYELKGLNDSREDFKEDTGALSFFRRIANHIANGISTLFGTNRSTRIDNNGNRIFYTIVLVRESEFPLIYDFEKVDTLNLRSDVGIHMLCKIADLNAFFSSFLVDQKMLSLGRFAETLSVAIKSIINAELSTIEPQNIDNNARLKDKLLYSVNNCVKQIYPCIDITQIISLTAKHEELEKLRTMKEELYIADLELEQLQLRYDYMNRLQSVENSNELNKARDIVDFEALMNKIDEDHLLNEDNHNKFIQMLQAQAEIRTAQTEIDKTVAINKISQTGLMSEFELATLVQSLSHKAEMDVLRDNHESQITHQRNTLERVSELAQWEREEREKDIDLEIDVAKRVAAFDDERREADYNYNKRESDDAFEQFRKLQQLRMEREDAEHKREMEVRHLQSQTELEKQKIAATMTFEQIMAMNPDISPEAAAALAKKYEAEAAAANNDRTIELVKQHDEDLKAILMQQMNMTRDIISAQNQANAYAVAAKQQELDRVHEDSERHQDRFVSAVQTTVTAVAGSHVTPAVIPMAQPQQPVVVFCSNCGKKFNEHKDTCDVCGSPLN